MTVERVKITPTQITLKDGNSKVLFDTDNQYVRTDPTGNLRLNTQMPALRFTTYAETVTATNVQGAILGYVDLNTLLGGNTRNLRFPEFTGSLVVTLSTFVEGGGQPQVMILYRVRVYINGSATVSNRGDFPGSRHVVFNPGTGGGYGALPLSNPPNWQWDNIQPGSLITLGTVYRTDSTGVTIVQDPATGSAPAGSAMMLTVIAIQNGISSLPLTVTP
jgi:hypothetical protein